MNEMGRRRSMLAASRPWNSMLGIQRVDAGQDLDERGFARTVLAEQRQDLAGAELEVNVVERQRAPEACLVMPRNSSTDALGEPALDFRRQSGRRGARKFSSLPVAAGAPQPCPGRCFRAGYLTYGPRPRLSMLFGRQLKRTRSRLHLGRPPPREGLLLQRRGRESGNTSKYRIDLQAQFRAQPLGEQS